MNINYTIIGQLIAFLVFVAFCMRYVWPPILAAMEERQQKIIKTMAVILMTVIMPNAISAAAHTFGKAAIEPHKIINK